MENSIHYTSTNHADELIEKINKHRQNEELCDLTIKVGDIKICAHRIVLSSSTPYFHNLFERTKLRDFNELTLDDVDPAAVQSLIDYCYTSSITITPLNVYSIASAAKVFEMEEIGNVCCELVPTLLNNESCLNCYQIAEDWNMSEDTINDIRVLVKDNFENVINEDLFLESSRRDLLVFIDLLSKDLYTEDQILQAVKAWIMHSIDDRQFHVAKIINHSLSYEEKLKDFLPDSPKPSKTTDKGGHALTAARSLADQLNYSTPEKQIALNKYPHNGVTPDGDSFDNQSLASYLDRVIAGSRETTPGRSDIDSVWLPRAGTNSVKSEGPQPSPSTMFGYKDCPICGKSITSNNMSKHIKTHNTGEQYACHLCDKKYSTKSNLQTHVRGHTGERPFECEICNRGFTSYCVLKVHQRTHTGEKPFNCDKCGQSFSKNIHLRRHAAIHTGEKPHLCTFCGKRFSRSDHLKRHVQSIHSLNRPHICNICSKDFVRKYELEKHMRQHHDWAPVKRDENNETQPSVWPSQGQGEVVNASETVTTEVVNASETVKTEDVSDTVERPSEVPYNSKLVVRLKKEPVSLDEYGNVIDEWNSVTDFQELEDQPPKKRVRYLPSNEVAGVNGDI